MRAVGIKVLKNRLSEFVRLAAGGETVLVLDREQVVAELVPPAPDRPQNYQAAWMEDAVRRGLIRSPLTHRNHPPKNFPTIKLDELLADLEESRQDRDLP